MKNKSHVLLRIIVIAAMLVLVVAAAIECANGKSLSETAWSLLPPVIAIVLALISKEAYSSLFIGVVVGALFTTNFAPVAALDAVVNDGLIAAIADNAGIFLFLVLLGIIVALVNAAAARLPLAAGQRRTSRPTRARSLQRSSSAFSFSSTTILTA